jgi:hypothetical protein
MRELLRSYVQAFNQRDAAAVAALFEDVQQAIAHGEDGAGRVVNATGDVLRFLGPAGRLALGLLNGEPVVVGLFPHEEGGWGRVGVGRLGQERDGKIVRIHWVSDQTLAWQARLVE